MDLWPSIRHELPQVPLLLEGNSLELHIHGLKGPKDRPHAVEERYHKNAAKGSRLGLPPKPFLGLPPRPFLCSTVCKLSRDR